MDTQTYLELSKQNFHHHADPLRSDYEEYVFLWVQENLPSTIKELKSKFDTIYSELYAARENQANQERIRHEFEDAPF